MTLDLTKLKAAAEAATPGPWTLSGDHIIQTRHITRDVWVIPHRDGDMAFIALADPTTVLELIRRLEQAETTGRP